MKYSVKLFLIKKFWKKWIRRICWLKWYLFEGNWNPQYGKRMLIFPTKFWIVWLILNKKYSKDTLTYKKKKTKSIITWVVLTKPWPWWIIISLWICLQIKDKSKRLLNSFLATLHHKKMMKIQKFFPTLTKRKSKKIFKKNLQTWCRSFKIWRFLNKFKKRKSNFFIANWLKKMICFCKKIKLLKILKNLCKNCKSLTWTQINWRIIKNC